MNANDRELHGIVITEEDIREVMEDEQAEKARAETWGIGYIPALPDRFRKHDSLLKKNSRIGK